MTSYTAETVFTWAGTPLKIGAGAAAEIGHDLAGLGVRRALVVTDPGVAATGAPERVAQSARDVGMDVEICDQVHVEPTDVSIRSAVDFAGESHWDAFVAVGGGSSIDTAKAVNLLTSSPADLMDYVNKPIGRGLAPAKPLKPLVAVPTTAGTGSETTPVCVMDFVDLKVKSGISHPWLRPSTAVIDPLLTVSMPPHVTASTGMDVLCHALESYTAKSFSAYPRHAPDERVAYCGANPIADVWAERAIGLIARSFRRAVLTGTDVDARTNMMLAATFAGMGFGNAGVHIPHACAYPIAGRVRTYCAIDYPREPLVPHGESVSLIAPAAFRFTFPTGPERHRRAAELLDPTVIEIADSREHLPRAMINLMRDIGVPNGIGAVGYGPEDVDDLVSGALQQHRLLTVAPREVRDTDLESIFTSSLQNW